MLDSQSLPWFHVNKKHLQVLQGFEDHLGFKSLSVSMLDLWVSICRLSWNSFGQNCPSPNSSKEFHRQIEKTVEFWVRWINPGALRRPISSGCLISHSLGFKMSGCLWNLLVVGCHQLELYRRSWEGIHQPSWMTLKSKVKTQCQNSGTDQTQETRIVTAPLANPLLTSITGHRPSSNFIFFKTYSASYGKDYLHEESICLFSSGILWHFPDLLDNVADVPSNTKHFETPADLMLRLHPPSDRNAPGAVNNIHNKAPQVERHVVGVRSCINVSRIQEY